MTNLETRLLEVRQLGQERVGIFDLPEKFLPYPGQYLPCQKHFDDTKLLPTHLFQVFCPYEESCLGPLPKNWYPGDRIRSLPPQGNGFRLPSSSRRLGLLSLGESPLRLLALTKIALAQNAAIALFCDPKPDPDLLNLLPPMVEVSSINSLQDNLDWPDFLGVDLDHTNLNQLNDILGYFDLRFEGQVLVRTPMPCHGLGECGICAVRTHHGSRLACVDGPVFSLQEVLHVA